MKRNFQLWKKYIATGLLGGIAILSVSNVVSDDVIDGKTIGEWQAVWWQWAYDNGFSDDSGAFDIGEIDCSLGQQGPVWFLAGRGVEECCDVGPGELPADRICIDPIPHGKRLFFPLINVSMRNPDSWCPPEAEDDGDDSNNVCTVEEKREIMDAALNDFEPGPLLVPEWGLTGSRVCYLSAYVDGVPVIYDGTIISRTQSPTFPLFDDPEAVADGFYVMLPQLPKGKHTIDFTGAICQFDGSTTPENIIFGSKIRYELTISK